MIPSTSQYRGDEGSASRADMHCHSTASELAKLGIQRSLGLPECATPPEEVYELAKAAGDGLRHDHRSRHDRRRPRDRRSPGLLRLRGADRPLCRRAAGGARPLLRDHRPGDHECLQAHAGDVEACAAYLHERRDHLRPRAPLLRRRGAADRAPPPPLGGALPDLGGPQRLARRGAEHAGRRLHRDPRRHRHRRLRRPCRRRHRPHLHRGARAPRRRKSFSPRSATGGAEARGEQGSAAKWAHAAMALATRAR